MALPLPAGTMGAQATIQGNSSHLDVIIVNEKPKKIIKGSFSNTFYVGLLPGEGGEREVKEQPWTKHEILYIMQIFDNLLIFQNQIIVSSNWSKYPS